MHFGPFSSTNKPFTQLGQLRLPALPVVLGWFFLHRRGRSGSWGREARALLAHTLPRCVLRFQVEKIDIEVMIAIGGALLIAALVLMCCFFCVYCKLAKVLR